jgi:hypothetical protein
MPTRISTSLLVCIAKYALWHTLGYDLCMAGSLALIVWLLLAIIGCTLWQ